MKQAYVNGDCFPMARGGTLRIEEGRGKLIHVWQGRVWLTQEGDRRDRYLEAGTSYRLDRRGTAIAYAASDAVISLGAPEVRPERFFSSWFNRLWDGLSLQGTAGSAS